MRPVLQSPSVHACMHPSTGFPAAEDLEVTIFDRLCYLAWRSTAIHGGARVSVNVCVCVQ